MSGTRFEQAEYYVTGILEQSAMTFVSEDAGFLVFGDESAAVWRVKPPAAPGSGLGHGLQVQQLRGNDRTMKNVEAATYDAEEGRVRALSEGNRRSYDLTVVPGPGPHLTLGQPKRVGPRLQKAQRGARSRYEGLTTLASNLSPDGKKWHVAVHERRPRRVYFLDPDTLKSHGHAKLPAGAKPWFPDLSDVAIDSGGALFLLSDEGCCFGEFALTRAANGSVPKWKLALIRMTPIATDALPLGKRRLQPEALAFDAWGHLWVLAETRQILIRFIPASG